jgi:hypothetical protein
MADADGILVRPAKGKGSRSTIRYHLPREGALGAHLEQAVPRRAFD